MLFTVVEKHARDSQALLSHVEADRQDAEMERLVGADDAPQDRAWGQNL
jgi:hypothetical protein